MKKKIVLIQIDWVDFTNDEKLASESRKQKPPEITQEVSQIKTEYQILTELGQLDLLK